MAYSVIDKVYTIFIDVMTGSSNGYGKPTFYNTDSHTSFIELTVTNGSKEFNMTEFSYMFTVEKPDGTKYTNEYTTKDKSKLVIPVDAQMISCTGNCNAQLYVNKEVDGVNKTLTMVEFNYTVYKGLHEGLISESVDFDNVYVKILNKLDYIINNGADLTDEQAQQLADAYKHSQSPHAPANVLETMHTEIGEAIDAHHKKVALSASQVGYYKGHNVTVSPSVEGTTNALKVLGTTVQNHLVGGKEKIVLDKSVNPSSRIRIFNPVVNLLKGVTYTLIVNLSKIENVKWGLRFYIYKYGVDTPQYIYTNANTKGFYTIKFTSTVEADRVALYMESEDFDNSGSIEFNNVMILEGDYTTNESYIPPYFEGIRSTGDKSKNLFDSSNVLTTGQLLSNNKTNPSQTKMGYTDFIPVEKGDYVLSLLSDSVYRIEKVYLYNSEKTETQSKLIASFTVGENDKFIRVSFTTSDWGNSTTFEEAKSTFKIQLERGTTSTFYEPYVPEGSTGVSLYSCGKNLLKPPSKAFTRKQGNIDITLDPEGVFTLSGTNSTSAGGRHLFSTEYTYRLRKGRTYTLSYEKVSGTSDDTLYPSLLITNINNHNDIPAGLNGTSAFSRVTFVADKDMIVFCGININQGKSYNNCKVKVQLEEGNQATAIVPYQEDVKSFIANIPNGLKGLTEDVCDTAYYHLDRKETWVQQNVATYTFTGDEEMSIDHTLADGCIKFFVTTVGTDIKANGAVMCNRLVRGTDAITNSVRLFSDNKIVVNIQSSLLPSADMGGFRQWLKDNPTIVYYQLNTPKYLVVSHKDSINLRVYNMASHICGRTEIMPRITFSLANVPMTTDSKQFCDTNINKNFILPDVSSLQENNALELHLFVKMKSNVTLSFPSNVLWNDLAKMNEIVTGSVAEFIFTYIKTAEGGSWLGTVVPHK